MAWVLGPGHFYPLRDSSLISLSLSIASGLAEMLRAATHSEAGSPLPLSFHRTQVSRWVEWGCMNSLLIHNWEMINSCSVVSSSKIITLSRLLCLSEDTDINVYGRDICCLGNIQVITYIFTPGGRRDRFSPMCYEQKQWIFNLGQTTEE